MMRFGSTPSTLTGTLVVVSLLLGAPVMARAQEKAAATEKQADRTSPPADRAQMLSAAREIMTALKYCALVTVDHAGQPQVRTMNPFPPDDDMVVYFATNTRSRKVREIEGNPRVTLYYADHAKATGYVALSGRAVLVDDPAEIQKRKRAYWDSSFEPGLKNLVLVKVVPETIEVLKYAPGFEVDRSTWRTPSVSFGGAAGTKD